MGWLQVNKIYKVVVPYVTEYFCILKKNDKNWLKIDVTLNTHSTATTHGNPELVIVVERWTLFRKQLYVIHIEIKSGPKNSGLCRQVVAIRRLSLALVWLYRRPSYFLSAISRICFKKVSFSRAYVLFSQCFLPFLYGNLYLVSLYIGYNERNLRTLNLNRDKNGLTYSLEFPSSYAIERDPEKMNSQMKTKRPVVEQGIRSWKKQR